MAKEIIIDENRGFKGVWIPKNLYACTELTPNEKFLLLEIYSLSKNNVCYANNKHFADFTGLKENTVQKAFLKFEGMGYLNRIYEYKDGTKEIKCRKLILTKKFYNELMNENVDNDVVEKNPQGDGLKVGDKYNNNKYNNNIINRQQSVDTDFDDDILENSKEITDDEMLIDGIEHYLNQFRETQGKPHPNIAYRALQTIVDNIHTVLSDVDDIEEFTDNNGLIKMIDSHFDTDYSKKIDYKLQHFATDRVLEYQARTCGFITGLRD